MSSTNSPPNEPLKMAILDDYQSLSPPYFQDIPRSTLSITHFPSTIPPTSTTALITRLHPFHIICAMRERTPLPAHILTSLPNLRLILTTGTRNAAIALPTCAARAIPVAGTPSDVPSPSGAPSGPPALKVIQHTWALILALANNVIRDDAAIRRGAWQNALPLGAHLAGKTFAVLGFGKLGGAAARVAVLAFGMKVLAWSASLTIAGAEERAAAMGLPAGSVEVASDKSELFRRADVLSVQYVLSERTVGMVGREELALLKPEALFVNTARAGLVDEDALFELLEGGRIRGAALEVWWREPMEEGDRWRTTKWGEGGRSALVMTPHTAYVTEETMGAWWEQTAANLKRWLKGEELVNRLV